MFVMAHSRVIEGSDPLGFATGVLTGYGYYNIYFLLRVFFMYAPLVVAHDRPSRVVVITSTGGPSSPCPNWPVERL